MSLPGSSSAARGLGGYRRGVCPPVGLEGTGSVESQGGEFSSGQPTLFEHFVVVTACDICFEKGRALYVDLESCCKSCGEYLVRYGLSLP